MRVLVVYASVFGSTRAIAERIAETLGRNGFQATVAGAGDAAAPERFDGVVVGSTVHGGHWLPEATTWLDRHAESLARMPLWLFSSGPIGDRATASAQADPREVTERRARLHAWDHRVFPGAFDRSTADFSERSLVERTVVRRLLPEGDWRDWQAIEAWAEGIARALLAAQREEVREGHSQG